MITESPADRNMDIVDQDELIKVAEYDECGQLVHFLRSFYINLLKY